MTVDAPHYAPPVKVAAGDISLALTDVGEGHPIVWLHGSGPGASGMSNFRQNLPAFADFRNLVFDHPRFGDSDRPHIDGTLIEHSGSHILAALDGLGVTQFAVVGNSFGGGVSAWLAINAPERVTAVVLMAPGGVTPPTVQRDGFPLGLQLIGKAMTQGVDRPLMEQFVNTMLYDKSLATDAMIDGRLEAALRNNPEMEGMNMGDLTNEIAKITSPTQILWGREDNFLPVAWSYYWLNSVVDSELHVIPRIGHWLQYEGQAIFDELAGEFLRTNTPKG